MPAHQVKSALRPAPDGVLSAIADYARNFTVESQPAYQTARYCLMDSLACALQALNIPACRKLLGPVVPGAVMPGGARVPGTSFELDPVQAAFNIGTLIRWLDFNDTWLAAEWGHPSDNLGGILAVADYLARNAVMSGRTPPSVRALLTAMIKAHEIQGVLALENSFNRVGLDHVLLVRVASTAVVADMLGARLDQIVNALSNAWIDGGALRTYRHAPNTGSRKSWAAGDATGREVRHAPMALTGEMGYASALSAKTWGFYDVLFKGKAFSLPQPFGSYVMENVLFKVSYPAEFHAQTAVEAAMSLHPQVRGGVADIERIVIETKEPGVRIIDKVGPLANPADRDHCLQYMVAVPLIFGRLTAADYEDTVAADARIDALRERMQVRENPTFTEEYYAADKRYIGNAVQVFFRDGSHTARVQVDVPIGHRRRRAEGMPVLVGKFTAAVEAHFAPRQAERIKALFAKAPELDGHRAEFDRDFTPGVIAPDLQLHAGARGDGRDLHRQLAGVLERGAVELEDHVAGFDSGVLRRPALLHARHQRPFGLRQAEGVRQSLGDGLDHHAELAAGDVAGGLQLLAHLHGDIDRDGERHAHVAAAAAVDLRVDAHDLAAHVEQLAAGVTRVDRHVGLDERHVAGFERAALGAHDARGGAVLEAERRADRQHPFPDLEPARVADPHRRQILGGDAQDRDIRFRVHAHDLGGVFAPVGEAHGHFARAVDDVRIGHDDAVRADDESRAFTAHRLRLRHLERQAAEERRKRTVGAEGIVVAGVVVGVVVGVVARVPGGRHLAHHADVDHG